MLISRWSVSEASSWDQHEYPSEHTSFLQSVVFPWGWVAFLFFTNKKQFRTEFSAWKKQDFLETDKFRSLFGLDIRKKLKNLIGNLFVSVYFSDKFFFVCLFTTVFKTNSILIIKLIETKKKTFFSLFVPQPTVGCSFFFLCFHFFWSCFIKKNFKLMECFHFSQREKKKKKFFLKFFNWPKGQSLGENWAIKKTVLGEKNVFPNQQQKNKQTKHTLFPHKISLRKLGFFLEKY